MTSAVLLVGALASPAASEGYDRPGATQRISVSSSEAQGKRPDRPPAVVDGCVGLMCGSSVSANGRFVAFESGHANLVPGDTNGTGDIFVRDLVKGTTERVSIASSGAEAHGVCMLSGTGISAGSGHPSISSDGRYVAFDSCAANLSSDDQNAARDVFIHDRATGKTELVSVASDGKAGVCAFSQAACSELDGPQAISADGRFVAFTSYAKNLHDGDNKLMSDVFVRDRKRGRTELLSDVNKGPVDIPNLLRTSMGATISASGRYVAFASTTGLVNLNDPTTLVSSALTDYLDVFVYDQRKNRLRKVDDDRDGRPEFVGVFREATITRVNMNPVGISGNGRYVAFTSLWSNYVPHDVNEAYDVFVRDLQTGRIERVSLGSAGKESANDSFGNLSLSHDGRFVAFVSHGGLVADDDEGGSCAPARDTGCGEDDDDIYVYDRLTGAAEAISRYRDGKMSCSSGPRCSPVFTRMPDMDATGRYVSFHESSDTEYVRNDTNEADDFFLRDRGSDLGIGSVFSSKASVRVAADEGAEPTVLLLKDRAVDRSPLPPTPAANLVEARVAIRPQTNDVLARVDVERLDAVGGVVYGVVLQTGSGRYEVRTSKVGPTEPQFNLFECARPDDCTKVAALAGGFGTVGEAVVARIPLEALGLEKGGSLRLVSAAARVGAQTSGVGAVLDRVR